MYTLIFLLYSLTFAVNADQGPAIDPNGGRQLTVHTDALSSDRGLGVDPNG